MCVKETGGGWGGWGVGGKGEGAGCPLLAWKTGESTAAVPGGGGAVSRTIGGVKGPAHPRPCLL